MKFLLLSMLLLLVVKSRDLNIGYEFLMFATDFCGNGKVRIADIGNGNLISLYNISEKELIAYRRKSNKQQKKIKPIPMPESLNVSSCSETQDKSCVGRGDTWYWCNYPQYRCMSPYVSQKEGNYTNIKVELTNDPWVFEGWLDNDSNETQTMHYSRTEKTTTTSQWTFTNTIEIGVAYSITLKVPLEMDATLSESFKWSSTDSKTTTMSTEESWNIDQDIVVPAHSTIKTTSIIKKAKYTGTYYAQMDLPFFAKLWCEDKVSDHYEWFYSAVDFLNCNPCNIGGPFVGWHGVNMQTSLKQCSLYSRDC